MLSTASGHTQIYGHGVVKAQNIMVLPCFLCHRIHRSSIIATFPQVHKHMICDVLFRLSSKLFRAIKLIAHQWPRPVRLAYTTIDCR